MSFREVAGLLERKDRARAVNIGCMRWGAVCAGTAVLVACVSKGLETWQETGSVALTLGWSAVFLVVGLGAGGGLGLVVAFGLPVILLPVFVHPLEWLRLSIWWAMVGAFLGSLLGLGIDGLDAVSFWTSLGAAIGGGATWVWFSFGCYLLYGSLR